jgi:hypothetical protein
MIGFGLDERERGVIEAHLRLENPQLKISGHPILSELSSGSIFYPEISERECESLCEWRVPIVAFVGRDRRGPHSDEFFYRSGIAAVWNFPDMAMPFLFPPPTLPESVDHIFLISDDAALSRMLRQIFLFSGSTLRIDFRNNDELTQTLEAMRSDPNAKWPGLIIADLDSQRVDTLGFFHDLKRMFIQDHTLRSRTRLMILKDFGKPGLDVRTIASTLRFFAKRIFHPCEALFAAVEAGFYRDLRIERGAIRYRDMDEILYGPEQDLPVRDPLSFINAEITDWSALRRAIPFLWIQNYLTLDIKRSGAILKPEPDVDTRDLFHGIRRP